MIHRQANGQVKYLLAMQGNRITGRVNVTALDQNTYEKLADVILTDCRREKYQSASQMKRFVESKK